MFVKSLHLWRKKIWDVSILKHKNKDYCNLSKPGFNASLLSLTGETSFQLFRSASLSFRSLVRAHDCRWGLEHRQMGNSRAGLSPSSKTCSGRQVVISAIKGNQNQLWSFAISVTCQRKQSWQSSNYMAHLWEYFICLVLTRSVQVSLFRTHTLCAQT